VWSVIVAKGGKMHLLKEIKKKFFKHFSEDLEK
jgi:hypothetical protein